MFCNICRQIFDFNDGSVRYTPEKRPLGGDTKALIYQQQRQKEPKLSAHTQIYEDFSAKSKNAEISEPIWWKTPVSQDGALTHSPSTGCQICSLIFSNVSGSIVKGIVGKRSDDIHNALAFVYKLTNPNRLQISSQEPDHKGLLKDLPKDLRRKAAREATRRMVRLAAVPPIKRRGSTLSIWLEVGKKLLPMIELNVTAAYESFVPKLSTDPNSLNTGSSDAFVLAASWLDNCISNHPRCMIPKGNDYRLPTRLIDVGGPDKSQNPRLWCPEKSSTPVQYIALSHRWGISRDMILTEASLPTLSKEIEASRLPRSYQDAIVMTRYLGIRYLWIDSLCIIQDSIKDWQAESAIMGDIYKNSYCTIAASWASSDAEGCFTNRGPLQARISTSQLINPNSQIRHSERRYQKQEPNNYETIDLNQGTGSETHLKLESKARAELSSNKEQSMDLLTLNRVRKPETHVEPQIARSPAINKPKQFQRVSKRRNSRQKAEDPMRMSAQRWKKNKTGSQSDDVPSLAAEPVFCISALQRDLWAHAVETSHLNGRAWALQERLLSPRILHYTKSQLFWECKEGKASESCPNPVPKVERKLFYDLIGMESTHELYGLYADPLHEHWLEIVEYYSGTSMTRPEDKLVAISGLAKEVQNFTKDTYCAGIWRRDLVGQLLWRMEISRHQTKMRYRAPSWSWASMDGKIKFGIRPPSKISPLVDILSIRTFGVDSRPWSLGQIAYGFLRVRGVLVHVQQCEWRGNNYRIFLTKELEEEDQADASGDFCPDAIPETLPKDLICLPIAHDFGDLAGLVLSPTGDFSDEYCRVGSFRTSYATGIEWMRKFEGSSIQNITLI